MTSRCLLFCLLGLALFCPLSAAPDQSILYSVIAPREPAAPGAVVTVQVAALNTSGVDATVDAPSVASAFVFASGVTSQAVTHVVAAGQARETIGPGRFAMRTVAVTLPEKLSTGPVMLELQLDGVGTLRTALEVRSTVAAAAPATPPESQRPTTNLVQAVPAAESLRRIFANRLSPHEPIYFVYGGGAPAAKFQFSFKYKLLEFTSLTTQRWARTLQFAFTQRSLWNLDGTSSPFYDTSYMPEIMYQSLAPRPEKDGPVTWLGFQAAFKHESNGRDGPQSRSLNTAYARPVLAVGALDGWHLLVIPEVFGYLDNLEDNPDIDEYRGYGRLHLVFGRNDGPSLMATLWSGRAFNHRSAQFDLTLPVRTHLLNFETYFLVQYFNGYGESLLAYRQKSENLRFGISLVR